MSFGRYPPCPHLGMLTEIPISTILNFKERHVCADCDCLGPNLWVCLYRDCLRVGCSTSLRDHSTKHNEDQPTHCIHMNLSTERLWCYKCQTEVFYSQIYNETEQEVENRAANLLDSGHGSYSTLQSNSLTHVNHCYRIDKNVNISNHMGGDTSDSSDNEDGLILSGGKPMGLVGLQNIGNTCYMNAALQALSNTIPLKSFFIECPAAVHLLSEDRKPGLSRQYLTLMRDMWVKKNGGYVTPSGILYGIRNVHAMFRGYHQHDTQEFLRNFMDQLHEELKQLCPSECSIHDVENMCMTTEEAPVGSSFESSEGEYETCDSGVSERSSLSDDNERPPSTSKRRLSRSTSPGRRLRARIHSSSVIGVGVPLPHPYSLLYARFSFFPPDSQPSSSVQPLPANTKKQTKYRSIISDIFDGKLLSSVQCLTCDRISSRVETFQDLSLPIPSRDHLVVLHGRPASPGVTCSEAVMPVSDGWIFWFLAWVKSWFYGPMVTLHDCLAAFFSTDELKGDNMYSCERCNKLRNGLKYSKVLQLPEVLCIHLKRFRHELMFSSKITSFVNFPLKGLDMRPYLHNDCISEVTNYELFSVICHHGTAGGGHYTCYSLNNNQWYEFDDQCVTRVSPEVVQNSEAYVLFYRKTCNANQAVKNKVIELSDSCDENDAAYVSKQWLSRFNTCTEPGPIDNSDFLCVHNSINPKRSGAIEQLVSLIPLKVYDYLYKKYGGCPPITSIEICPECQSLHRRIISESECLQQLNSEYELRMEPASHLLSNNWYTQWKNFVEKRTLEPPGPIDNIKTKQEDFLEINEDIWNFFQSIYGGGPERLIQRESPVVIPPPPPFPPGDNINLEDTFCHGEPIVEMEVGDEPEPQTNEDSMTGAIDENHSNSNPPLSPDDEVALELNAHKRRKRKEEKTSNFLLN